MIDGITKSAWLLTRRSKSTQESSILKVLAIRRGLFYKMTTGIRTMKQKYYSKEAKVKS